MTTAYAGGLQRKYDALAATIRSVLSLSSSPSDILSDSVRTAVAQGHTIDAIRLVRLEKGLSLTEAKAFVEQLSQVNRS